MGKMQLINNITNNRRGFSLLELSLTLVIVGLLYAATASVLPWIAQDVALQKTRVKMEDLKRSIIAFALTNHRLPCPDTSSTRNGLEGATSCGGSDVVGGVPYETLLLDGSAFDSSQQNIVYGVYRNATTADLGALVNLVNRLDEVDGSLNKYDFCQALKNASAVTPSNIAFVSASTDTVAGGSGCGNTSTFQNLAFLLASSGYENADGSVGANAFFDGQNDAAVAVMNAAPFCFESPLRSRDSGYDDIVMGVSFTSLLGEVCS